MRACRVPSLLAEAIDDGAMGGGVVIGEPRCFQTEQVTIVERVAVVSEEPVSVGGPGPRILRSFVSYKEAAFGSARKVGMELQNSSRSRRSGQWLSSS